MDPKAQALPGGGSIAVLRGAPTDDELAAVVMAIDAAGLGRPDEAAPRPAWLTAARLGAVGGRPAAGPADLRAAQRLFE